MLRLAAKAYNSGVPLNTSFCQAFFRYSGASRLPFRFGRVILACSLEDDDAFHKNRALECVREFSDISDRSALRATI
jgi:hypothetical protein